MKNVGILMVTLIVVASAVLTASCGVQGKATPTPTHTPVPTPTHTATPAPTRTPMPTPNPGRSLQEQFVDGFVLTYNSMAEAERLHREAADQANVWAFQAAAAKMAQAKTDAEGALPEVPSGVVAEMGKQGGGGGEGKVVDLLSSRVASFVEGAGHFLNSLQYAQRGNITGANNETDLANEAFGKSAQAYQDLYDLVKTDPALRYLRDAVGWAE